MTTLLRSMLSYIFAALLACGTGFSQTPAAKVEEISVITFYPDKQITVKLEADPDFSGAQGTVKVDLNRNGKVSINASFKSLKSPLDIGGQYSTYVLWAVLGDGSTERLGALKVNGKDRMSSPSLGTEKTLSTFGMVLTAEPHFMPRLPSRKVVMRSASTTTGKNSNLSEARKVSFAFTDNDYTRPLPKFDKKEKKAENAYRSKPLLLYGARYACDIAKDAGAESYAVEKYNLAIAERDKLEEMWNRKAKTEEIEVQANNTITLAAEAEAISIAAKRERKAQQEKNRAEQRDLEQEERIGEMEKEISRLKAELDQARAERDRYLGGFEEKSGQLSLVAQERRALDARVKELEKERIDLLVKNRELEIKFRQLEIARSWGGEKTEWKRFLADYGTPVVNGDDVVVTLAETIWMQVDSGELNVETVDIVPLLKKLVEADYLNVTILSIAMPSDDSSLAEELADARAKRLKDEFIRHGMGTARIGTAIDVQRPAAKKKKGVTLNKIELHLTLRSAV